MKNNELYPEDQKRVEHYLREGYNETERSPFRPMRLMLMLVAVIVVLSIASVVIVRVAGLH